MNLKRAACLCALVSLVSIDGFAPARPRRGGRLLLSNHHETFQDVNTLHTQEQQRITITSLQVMTPRMNPPSIGIGPGGATTAAVLNPWESWCVIHMEKWYRTSLAIKCPFFRRRAADALDALDMIMRFLVIRHKSLELLGPPPAWRCQGMACEKRIGLSVQETADVIREDWREETNKSYYITGKLTTAIYRDDCFFDGPDPDMPVKGLRKYLNAASQLFDQRQSFTELLSLDVEGDTIVAKWKMQGILMLPWRPVLPEWTGTTTYYRDEVGLIYKHSETWDLSVAQAFIRTFLPQLAERIWSDEKEESHEECPVG